MGLFTKSMVILLIATSTPLLYRQFANDNTIKFMSSYYSNYKVIDHFLRQSAGHLDKAKEYLNSEELKSTVNKLSNHITTIIDTTKLKLQEASDSFAKKEESDPNKNKNKQEQKITEKKKPEEKPKENKVNFRYCQCPGEDYKGQDVRLYSKDELLKYDDKSGEQNVYIGFLGLVYDVTANKQHYAAGAEYNAFAGKDATRAFVTGNFTHDLHDNIQDLEDSLYSHIESWASFYNSNYPILGRIEGQFFDSKGCGTQELARVYQVFNKLDQVKATQNQQDNRFPECNSEWNSDLKKGKVWCSTKSGGVDREWVGVPRIYSNGESQRCACFNLDDPSAKEFEKYMGVYKGCDPKANECSVAQ